MTKNKNFKMFVNVSLIFSALTFFAVQTAISAPSNNSIRHNHDAAKKRPPFPKVKLKGVKRADKAIEELGDSLPDVAAWYRHTPEKLKKLMKNEHTMWIDEDAHLFYIDEGMIIDAEAGQAVDRDYGDIFDDPIPVDQAFLLHSSPGAKKVIYLDFNGHVIPANSAWATYYNGGQAINAPAWNLDGDATFFNDQERTSIIKIWRRVAEDYAPFDVDVTTEEPPEENITRDSSSDEYYGTRVLISPISYIYGNAGGVAYVGIFDMVGDYYKPALIFPEKLANGIKYIAEACSHEAGHNLGLSHDGKTDGTEYYGGQGNWAPIMGVSYYKSISQWSKGEYAGANNTQDDYVMIQQNGLSFYPDDHGNSIAEASPLSQSGDSVSSNGVIETPADQDVFVFNTGSGAVEFFINPGLEQPNLDIQAKLVDGFNNVLASSDLSGLSAVIQTNVAAGTYYLVIDGVGAGDPLYTGYSDYGSLGQYTIDGTIVSAGSLTPPNAVVSAYPTSGPTPFSTQFAGSDSSDSDGVIVSYLWDFGDGTSSSLPDPSKTYTIAGNYTVTLTVTDDSGLNDSSSMTVTAENTPPVASMTTSSVLGIAPLTVTFDASASYDPDGEINSYNWNYGEGSTGSGITSQKIYFDPGVYTAQLTVTDNKGAQGSTEVMITVESDPSVVQAPTNLVGQSSGANVTLTWTDNSSNEEGFAIERAVKRKGKNSGTPSYSEVGRVSASVTTFTESVADGSYYYRIRAFNASSGVFSSYSSAVTVNVKNSSGGGGKGGGGKGGGSKRK